MQIYKNNHSFSPRLSFNIQKEVSTDLNKNCTCNCNYLRVDLLLWGILDDEGGELVPHVQGEDVAAGLARGPDHVFLHLEHGLRVLALFTQHKLLDEPVQHVLHPPGVVAAVDNVALILHVELGLGAQLAAKVLGDVGGGTSEGPGHVHHVDQDGLDAVALALHLGLDAGHLVAVEGVLHVAVHVQSHDDGDYRVVVFSGLSSPSFSFRSRGGMFLILVLVCCRLVPISNVALLLRGKNCC